MRFGTWLARIVAVAAMGLAVCLVLIWLANFVLTKTVADSQGSEPVLSAMVVLGWTELGLALVVVVGLAVGAWVHRPLWARGVASVIIGMVLHWGWWVLDRRVDLFGTSDPSLAPADLAARVDARMWTTLAVDVVAVLLLLLGGVLLLRHRAAPMAVDAPESVDPVDAV